MCHCLPERPRTGTVARSKVVGQVVVVVFNVGGWYRHGRGCRRRVRVVE